MKLTELYFTKDEAQRISLKYLNGFGADGTDPDETLDQFLTFSKVNYDNNAAEINKELKKCDLRPLQIETRYSNAVGTLIRVDNQWFCRKETIGDYAIYKSATFTNYRPIYMPHDAVEFDDYYTGEDFLRLCNGDTKKAERLFKECTWALPEVVLMKMEQNNNKY